MFFKKKNAAPQLRTPWGAKHLLVNYQNKIHKIPTRDLKQAYIESLQTDESNASQQKFKLLGISEGSETPKELMLFSDWSHAKMVQGALFGFTNSGLITALKLGAVFLVTLFILSAIMTTEDENQIASNSSFDKNDSREEMRKKLFNQLQINGGLPSVNARDAEYSFNPKINIPKMAAPELKCAPAKEIPQITSIAK